MLQKKAPQLNELCYCMSIENNKYQLILTQNMQRGKTRKTILVLQINYVYCCCLINPAQLGLEWGGT